MNGKRIYRTEGHDCVLAGVCGGIAEYFGLDPSLVRVGMALLAIVGASTGFWIYLVCAFVFPKKSDIYPGC